jgi:translation initiation factor 2 subunit 1
MYESEYPQADDIVVVLVKEIQPLGGTVHLLEYDNCEGMIMLSELSRRRIRSVNKLLKVGHQEYAAVVRVDADKGYIDLSKRRVAKEDIEKIAEKWNKSRTVHSIVRHVAETVGVDMLELYQRWGWPLYKRHPHAYDGLRIAVNDPDAVLEGLDIRDNERDELLRNVSRRLTPQAIKVRADIEVTCFRRERRLLQRNVLSRLSLSRLRSTSSQLLRFKKRPASRRSMWRLRPSRRRFS